MSNEHDNPIDAEISDIYRSTQSEGPSAALDAAILAQAEAAVEPKRKRPAWIAPVGLAATVMLGVNLAMNLKDYTSDPNVFSEQAQPVAQSPATRESSIESSTTAERKADKLDDTAVANDMVAAPVSHGNNGNDNTADSKDLRKASLPEPEGGNTDPRADAVSAPVAEQAGPGDAQPAPQKHDVNRANEQIVAAQNEAGAADTASTASEREKQEAKPQLAAQTAREPVQVEAVEQPLARPAPVTQAPIPRTTDLAVAAAPVEAAQELRNRETATAIEPAPRPDDDSAQPQTASSADLESGNEQTAQDFGIEEITVTGSRAEDIDDSPHRRMTAKAQAKRNQRQLSSRSYVAVETDSQTTSSTTALDSEVGDNEVYVCNLDALGVDTDAIETAKVDARTLVEPRLNPVTWPQYIRDLADEGDYVSACAHLAAYRQLFPDVVQLEPLPIALPPLE